MANEFTASRTVYSLVYDIFMLSAIANSTNMHHFIDIFFYVEYLTSFVFNIFTDTWNKNILNLLNTHPRKFQLSTGFLDYVRIHVSSVYPVVHRFTISL